MEGVIFIVLGIAVIATLAYLVVFRILCHSITINTKGMTHDNTETSVRHGCGPEVFT